MPERPVFRHGFGAPMTKLAVIAIGGSALIPDQEQRGVDDQYRALCASMEHVAEVAAQGWRLVITHGNGPQVGFIMLRSEIARLVAGMHLVPLVSCVADTQGAMGYQIQQALGNELVRRGLPGLAVSLITQVRVDPADPGFQYPDKFVGEFYSADQLDELTREHPDWLLRQNGKRGWQRVVPSPEPRSLVEIDAVRRLLDGGCHVISAGGGGIPVVETPTGLEGRDAVIDKDLTAALLATELQADLLILTTGVDQVALNFDTPLEKPLGRVSMADMEGYLAEGHFPHESMGPKVRAAINFLQRGGREVIITRAENLHQALTRDSGTHIVR